MLRLHNKQISVKDEFRFVGFYTASDWKVCSSLSGVVL